MPLLQEMCFKLPTFGQEVKIDEQLVEMLRRAKAVSAESGHICGEI